MRVAILGLSLAGCMAATPLPTQTPAQVSACSSDATWHNVTGWAASALGAGTTAESAAGAAVSDANTKTTLAVAGIVTGAVGLATALASQAFASAYGADGCSPPLAPASFPEADGGP